MVVDVSRLNSLAFCWKLRIAIRSFKSFSQTAASLAQSSEAVLLQPTMAKGGCFVSIGLQFCVGGHSQKLSASAGNAQLQFLIGQVVSLASALLLKRGHEGTGKIPGVDA